MNSVTTTEKTLIEKAVLAFAKQTEILANKGFSREALLLRLCYHGMQLKSALQLPKRYFFIETPRTASMATSQKAFQSTVVSLTLDFTGHERPTWILSLIAKVAWMQSRKTNDPREWLTLPLFVSRKEQMSLCSRSAQRLLFAAQDACKFDQKIGFRDAFVLGKRMRSIAAVRYDEKRAEEEIANAMRAIQWFFYQAFKNPDDREEAKQETRLKLFTFVKAGREEMKSLRLKTLGLQIARSVYTTFLTSKLVNPETFYEDFDSIADKTQFHPLHDTEAKERMEAINDALFGLNAIEREIIINLFIRELDIRAAASRMRLAPATVIALKRKSIKKLRKMYFSKPRYQKVF